MYSCINNLLGCHAMIRKTKKNDGHVHMSQSNTYHSTDDYIKKIARDQGRTRVPSCTVSLRICVVTKRMCILLHFYIKRHKI